MSGILSLMYVQSLFQLGAKVGKWEGYYGDKKYLDMFFKSFFWSKKDWEYETICQAFDIGSTLKNLSV